MKKAILLFTVAAIFLSLAPNTTNAQFVKGDMLAEGGLGNLRVSNNKTTYEDQNGVVNDRYKDNGFSIGIFPRFGFFVTNNLAIGTTLGLNYSSNKSIRQNDVTSVDESESKSSYFNLEVMPFLRYYFGKTGTTRFYGQVGGGISVDLSRKYESKSLVGPAYNTKTNYTKKPMSVSGEAMVGLNHFVSQNVAVNAGLGYRYTSSKETYTYTNPFGVTGNPEKYINKGGALIWNVGFTMIIPCKKKK